MVASKLSRRRFLLTLIASSSSLSVVVLLNRPNSSFATIQENIKSIYQIRVHFVITAAVVNDSNDSIEDPPNQSLISFVETMNQVYTDSGIQFDFDPYSDVERVVDQLLAYEAPRNASGKFEFTDNPQKNNICVQKWQEYAEKYPGKLVIYYRVWRPEYEGHSAFNFSGLGWEFVRMGKGANGVTMAHEVGHYFGLIHTFTVGPKSIAEASAMIKKYVEDNNISRSDGLKVFDGDAYNVGDTPPDPGGGIFIDYFGDTCLPDKSTVPIPVTFSDGSTYVYNSTPDRANIMSYYGCPNMTYHLSVGQINVVRKTLQTKVTQETDQLRDRHHLIEPRLLFDALWQDGTIEQTYVLGWAASDFFKKIEQEINSSKHITMIVAYPPALNSGQVHYVAVWNKGSTGQTWALGWGFSDFAKRFEQELRQGRRCVHMQVYDLGGGQIRYDGIWENVNLGQTWALGWGFSDFAKRFEQELRQGRRCVHMQAYDIGGGQIRYDGIWENGNLGQTWALGWGLSDFARYFDQQSLQGRHCVHMQAYDLGGGQIRYDGIWENGDLGQTRALGWGFNDFVKRFDQEWSQGRHCVRLQAVDIGNGQIRYDGIWENANVKQSRALGLTFDEFAQKYPSEIAKGMHLAHVQPYICRNYLEARV
jgi:Bacterial tandem repeat domain 1